MKEAKRMGHTTFGLDTSRTKLAFARAALALLRPDFVSTQDRVHDAAYLSNLANEISKPEKPCRKED